MKFKLWSASNYYGTEDFVEKYARPLEEKGFRISEIKECEAFIDIDSLAELMRLKKETTALIIGDRFDDEDAICIYDFYIE